MNKSQIFKRAHQLAKSAHTKGNNYAVTFGEALKSVYREARMSDKDKNNATMLIGTSPDSVLVRAEGSYWIANGNTKLQIVCTHAEAKANDYWVKDDDDEETKELMDEVLAALGI